MRLVTFSQASQTSTGALVGDWVVDLPRLCGAPAEMIELLRSEQACAQVQKALNVLDQTGLRQVGRPAGEVSLRTPVLRPGKIIGVGMNYPGSRGSSHERPPYPVLFERNAGSLIGPGEAIRLPEAAQETVIECELVLVIGRGGKHIPESSALEAVAGYTLANDATVRDFERRSSQWTTGKLLDAFLPVGPAVVTGEEAPDTSSMRIQSWIDGEQVQDGTASGMLYSPAELVAYVSTLITLEAGDLILTGSPKMMNSRPAPLAVVRPGNRVRIAISGIGVMENPVVKDDENG
jgi:2-keto-4-pentenoate hydratase/2-oxohepta-3-ene-1,7-dioic acid hydratase in catechol pathway